jgi:hypothetical protein
MEDAMKVELSEKHIKCLIRLSKNARDEASTKLIAGQVTQGNQGHVDAVVQLRDNSEVLGVLLATGFDS